jgi:hypothetical protein
MVKIVNDELTRLMGPVDPKVYYSSAGTDRGDDGGPSGFR